MMSGPRNCQHLQAANHGLIVREDAEAAPSSDGTYQNIHDTALYALITTEVEASCGFHKVVLREIFVRERIENLLGF